VEDLRGSWEDNIKMDIQEVEWKDVDWVKLAQDRDNWRDVVNMMTNLQVPQNSGKILD
jgi:hypothetical protein